jgi:hypothetical protein
MYAWLVEETTIAAKAKDDFMLNGMHNFENTLSISTVSSVDRRVDRDGLLVAGSSAGCWPLHYLILYRAVFPASSLSSACGMSALQNRRQLLACLLLASLLAIFVGIFWRERSGSLTL